MVLNTIKDRIEESLPRLQHQSVQKCKNITSSPENRRHSADAVMGSVDSSPHCYRRRSLPDCLEPEEIHEGPIKAKSTISIPSMATESNTESDYDKLSIHSPKILTSTNTVSQETRAVRRRINYSICVSDGGSLSDDTIQPDPITITGSDDRTSIAEVEPEEKSMKDQDPKYTVAPPDIIESPYVYTLRERSKTEPVISYSPIMRKKPRRHSAATARDKAAVVRVRKKKRLSSTKRTRQWQARQVAASLIESDSDTDEAEKATRQTMKPRTESNLGTKKRSNTLERRGAFRTHSSRHCQQRPYIHKKEKSKDDGSCSEGEQQNPSLKVMQPTETTTPSPSGNTPRDKTGNYLLLNTANMTPDGQVRNAPIPPPVHRQRVPIGRLGKSMSVIETSPIRIPLSRPVSMDGSEYNPYGDEGSAKRGSPHIYMDLDTIKELKEKLQRSYNDKSNSQNEIHRSTETTQATDSEMTDPPADMNSCDTKQNIPLQQDVKIPHTDIPEIVVSADEECKCCSESEGGSKCGMYEFTKYLYPPSIFPIRSASDPDREKFLRFREKRRQSAPPTWNGELKLTPHDKSKSAEILRRGSNSYLLERGIALPSEHIKLSAPGMGCTRRPPPRLQLRTGTKCAPTVDPGVIIEVCDEDICKEQTKQNKNNFKERDKNGMISNNRQPTCLQVPLTATETIGKENRSDAAIDVNRSRSNTNPCPRGRCSSICDVYHVHVGKSTFFNEPRQSGKDVLSAATACTCHTGKCAKDINGNDQCSKASCYTNDSEPKYSTTSTPAMKVFHGRSVSAPVEEKLPYLDESEELATESQESDGNEEASFRYDRTQSCRDFTVLDRHAKLRETGSWNELTRSNPGYRSLPERRSNDRIYDGSPERDSDQKECPCPEPTRKNLTKYLGIPADLKDPLESPPSLPDRPKQFTSSRRISKTRRVRLSVMAAFGLSPKSKISEPDESDQATSGDEMKGNKRRLQSVAAWPLDHPSHYEKRKSVVQINDLYSIQRTRIANGNSGSSSNADSDNSPPLDLPDSTDIEPGKTLPAPFPLMASDAYLLGASRCSIVSGESVENTEERISPTDSNIRRQSSDPSLTEALSEHLMCWSGCPHSRRSPMTSIESSPGFTPQHSRHASDEVFIPIQHCTTFPDSPPIRESTYMNMGPQFPTNDAPPENSNATHKLSDEIYMSMDQIQQLELSRRSSESDMESLFGLVELFAQHDENLNPRIPQPVIPEAGCQGGCHARTRRTGVACIHAHVLESEKLNGVSEA